MDPCEHEGRPLNSEIGKIVFPERCFFPRILSIKVDRSGICLSSSNKRVIENASHQAGCKWLCRQVNTDRTRCTVKQQYNTDSTAVEHYRLHAQRAATQDLVRAVQSRMRIVHETRRKLPQRGVPALPGGKIKLAGQKRRIRPVGSKRNLQGLQRT